MVMELIVPYPIPNSVAIRERKNFPFFFSFFFLRLVQRERARGCLRFPTFGLKVDASV